MTKEISPYIFEGYDPRKKIPVCNLYFGSKQPGLEITVTIFQHQLTATDTIPPYSGSIIIKETKCVDGKEIVLERTFDKTIIVATTHYEKTGRHYMESKIVYTVIPSNQEDSRSTNHCLPLFLLDKKTKIFFKKGAEIVKPGYGFKSMFFGSMYEIIPRNVDLVLLAQIGPTIYQEMSSCKK